MELIRYARVVRRWAWLIILCPFVAAIAAGLISLQLPRMYESKVLLYVRTAQLLTPESGVAPVTADQILRTYSELMVTPPQLQKVIYDENLATDPASLARRISVTPHPNTLILEVAVQDSDPGRAQRTASSLVNEFIAYVKDIQTQENKPATASSGQNSKTPAATPTENLVIASPATLPGSPVSPRPLLNIGLGILAGLAVGVGLAFLFDYLDQSVRSDEILQERVGLVPLGHISYLQAKPEKRGELVTLGGNSPITEAYKALRTNLLFSGVDREIKTIVVTSAVPSEGKSRTAANLAIVLAEAGHSTLLVDADFRRPSQHRLFGKVRNLGLSNLIVQDVPEGSLFMPDEEVKNLVVLPSGPTPPNPSELLGSGQMKALLAKFRKGFDYVVIDTPPVNAVTDAPVVAASSDAAILVVDTNKATYPAVQHAKQALERVGAKVLGTVMNKMKAAGGSYYYYSYDYSYGHPNGKPAQRSSTSPIEEPEAQVARGER